jgi:hypothetical protein
VPRHPFADERDELLDRLVLVLAERAAERDGPQGRAVGFEEVDPAVVVVDQRAEFGRDRLADRLGVVEGVQAQGEGVQEPQLLHRSEVGLGLDRPDPGEVPAYVDHDGIAGQGRLLLLTSARAGHE